MGYYYIYYWVGMIIVDWNMVIGFGVDYIV